MAGAFDITTTSTSVKLPPSRTGQLVFTVTNTSGRQLTVRGVIVTPQSPDQKAWFNIEGAVERPAPPNVGLQYIVNIAVPMSAPAGPAVARLDAIAREDPDAYQTQGPAIVVDVPPAVVPPARKQFPWWIVAVAVAVLLLLGGGGYGAYRLLSKPSPTPDPADRFVGDWKETAAPPPGYQIAEMRISRQGSSNSFQLNGTGYCEGVEVVPCNFVATGAFDRSTGKVQFPISISLQGSNVTLGAIASLDSAGTTLTLIAGIPGIATEAYVFSKNCAACPLIMPSPTVIVSGTWVNTQTSSLDYGARYIVVQSTASGFVATPYFSDCPTDHHWCDVNRKQSGPAAYSYAKQQLIFTWSDSGHTVQLTMSFTRSGQMVGVMTFDGGDPTLDYTFIRQ